MAKLLTPKHGSVYLPGIRDEMRARWHSEVLRGDPRLLADFAPELRVRGHEKVPTGGQIKVPTPCSSCRSGTAGPGGDGEGANHSSPPPGSSIEVCEGPHGHHFCLSTSRVIPRRRRAVRHHPQDRQTGRGEVRSRRDRTTAG